MIELDKMNELLKMERNIVSMGNESAVNSGPHYTITKKEKKNFNKIIYYNKYICINKFIGN